MRRAAALVAAMVPLLFVATACSSTPDAHVVAPTTTTIPPSEISPSRVLLLAGDNDVTSPSGSVNVGGDGSGLLLVRFDVVPQLPCMAKAVLHVAGTGAGLYAYPADPNLADLQPGGTLRYADSMIDIRPRTNITFADGVGTGDATNFITVYEAGGPFPSKNHMIPRRGPVLMILWPQSAVASIDVASLGLTINRKC